jgi:virginiamycin B lyase
MWRLLLSGAIAAFLCLDLPTTVENRVALAQVSVSLAEWTVPTKGSHPHDPPRGGRRLNLVHGTDGEHARAARSEDGIFQGVSDEDSGLRSPWSLVTDQDGNIWFTANFAGYIGKLDPKTGAIIEYRLPDEAHDPRTPVFDQARILWFTVQGANMIGKLMPKTGEIKLVQCRPPTRCRMGSP